eukprot:TRINITY_DN39258_c0_g1_i1.p1 TRINITY_DN39258_c0_g1~~TRINITY_DN39258_c0_g1_i1.p1  ORF type:complete len:910 (+),score=139.01 TRINITY_DN39258_c0_g1_i1:121-2850(+)
MGTAAKLLFLPRQLFKLVVLALQTCVGIYFLHAAYDIRLYSVKDFGFVIHEFDPWFNYRAAEHLAKVGLRDFFKWYDYMSWYPLGRPVGTTVYPGMQMTAVGIWALMKRLGAFSVDVPDVVLRLRPHLHTLELLGLPYLPKLPSTLVFEPMSVNDICVMMPAWFAAIASFFTGLLAYEISRSVNAGLLAAGVMAVIPAHLMRSMAGEFDNESVAMAAICSTFWFWIRSVRTPRSWPVSVFASLSYIYMVASWGGYIFVINMIGVHAFLLVLLGRFNSGVHKAYTIFFIIGVTGAVQIPVVGWQPLRSMEQMGPLLVFLLYQVLAFCDWRRKKLAMTTDKFVEFRTSVLVSFFFGLLLLAGILYPMGFFGPLSARIRSLFMRHTKTGNPLVDSVAEHRPANRSVFASYLHLPLQFCFNGALVCAGIRNNGCYFLALYGFIAAHFSNKMSRLVLICGPVCSVACGIWWGCVVDFLLLEPVLVVLGKRAYNGFGKNSSESSGQKWSTTDTSGEGVKTAVKASKRPAVKASKRPAATTQVSAPKPVITDTKGEEIDATKPNRMDKQNRQDEELPEWEDEWRTGGIGETWREVKRVMCEEEMVQECVEMHRTFRTAMDGRPLFLAARILALAFLWHLTDMSQGLSLFLKHCDRVARSLSEPQVVSWETNETGERFIMDDYLKGYQWLQHNTPEDTRVMAWWDYGYQITGIGKRTSLADGNTWNHEHIAMLGRTLTSPEDEAWYTVRHLADYVLVWAGDDKRDDVAKSRHLALIGNSVFPDHCGDDDPTCDKYRIDKDGAPTPMMARSLLYRLVKHGYANVEVDERLFREVHTTKHGRLRIFQVMNVSQESKSWSANPSNRICDALGSWFCVGQYPPALDELIAKRHTFAQGKDFNKRGVKTANTSVSETERQDL